MKVVVYGMGKFAEYIGYILMNKSEFDVCAFCVDRVCMVPDVNKFKNLPLLEFETIEESYPPNEYKLFIAVGHNEIRAEKIKMARKKGYSLVSFLSPRAIVFDDLKYGENVFVGEGSGIQPFSSLGDGTIAIGARIGHHAKIGANVLLSDCTLAGNVIVKDNSFLGLNSSIKQNITIGRNNIIGMGCTIGKNTKDFEVYSCQKQTVKRNFSADKIQMKYLK